MSVQYDVTIVNLPSHMLDELMSWMQEKWGGLELTEIQAHEERL